MSKQKSGFTIIETMLFIAITGLVFAGVIIGTNGSIRSQRYRDTVQGFVNSLRDIYSRAENTEIASYSGKETSCGYYEEGGISSDTNGNTTRGRSNCVIYGLAATIFTEDSGEAYVMSSLLGGMDEAQVKKNFEYYSGSSESLYDDEVYLRYAGVNDFFTYNGGKSWTREGIVNSKLLWGAKVHTLCTDEMISSKSSYKTCNKDGDTADNIGVELIVYRSPNTGSIESFARYVGGAVINPSIKTGNAPNNSLIKFDDSVSEFESVKFKHRDVSFCIEPGDGMSSSGGMRMVTIDGDGTGENAIRLIEADSEENKCNK